MESSDSEGSENSPSKRFKIDDSDSDDEEFMPMASTSRAFLEADDDLELPDDAPMSSNDSLADSVTSNTTGTTARIEIETITSDGSFLDSDTEEMLPSILNDSSQDYSQLSPFAIIVNDIHDDEVDFIEASISNRSNEINRVLNGVRPNRDLRRLLYSSSSDDTSRDSSEEAMRHQRPTTSAAAAARTRRRREQEDRAELLNFPDLPYANYPYDSDDTTERNVLDTKTVSDLLGKPHPQYNWNLTFELMNREQDLHGGRVRPFERSSNPIKFQNELYSSRHTVEKLKLTHTLQRHHGCVNCLNFNKNGNLLCTGSDDLKIICWDWAIRKPKIVFKSGHTANIFQTRFLETKNEIKIISSGRDGQIRNAIVRPSGLIVQNALYKHTAAVHKISFRPGSTNEIYSSGEDGIVARYDLRTNNFERVLTVRTNNRLKLRLFSIDFHPFEPQFCVCGNDQYVRVYDTRNVKVPMYRMCGAELANGALQRSKHISSAIYNNTGSEILASYSSDDVYLFDNKTYLPGTYLHRYRGHNNIKTNKCVAFFGPTCEYVMSGSDCGNIFFWNKHTESIVNWIDGGDRVGIVNCLESHPTIPVLATSGMENVVKIWAPSNNTYPPTMRKLDKCIKNNLKKNISGQTEYYDDRTFFYFIRQFLQERGRNANNEPENFPTVESSTSNSDDEDCEEDLNPEIPCHPQ